MDTNEIITAARDAMTVRRVFGDVHVQDGVTVIPAALVIGGVGAGSGERAGDAGEAGDSGGGGGFGVVALPRGVFTISAGRVRWHPAVSVNLLVVAVTAVAVTYLRARSRSTKPAG
jgi:uncharacterized spore protein YtfJ